MGFGALNGGMKTMPRFPFLVPQLRAAYLRSMSVIPGPICWNFVPVEQRELDSITKSDGVKFRLVSYNILAQAYLKSAIFPHSPSPCLRWKSRSLAILTVLKELEADFLCLQEVDEYDSFYKKNMEVLGYNGIYIKRSGRKRDGCAIFYRTNSAELVVEEKIDYNDLGDAVEDGTVCNETEEESKSCSESRGNREDRRDLNDPRVRLKRDCVGLMALFKLKNPLSQYIIIANTHLYWDPELADVKLAQAKYLLSRLAGFRKFVSEKFHCSPSIILAGDFNSVPGDQVYRYVVSDSKVDDEDQRPTLSSVYAFTGGEPEFTNCTPGFTGTLDYVFFSGNGNVTPVSYLELPGLKSSDVVGSLPNYFHPSDHLPIGAEFYVDA